MSTSEHQPSPCSASCSQSSISAKLCNVVCGDGCGGRKSWELSIMSSSNIFNMGFTEAGQALYEPSNVPNCDRFTLVIQSACTSKFTIILRESSNWPNQ